VAFRRPPVLATLSLRRERVLILASREMRAGVVQR